MAPRELSRFPIRKRSVPSRCPAHRSARSPASHLRPAAQSRSAHSIVALSASLHDTFERTSLPRSRIPQENLSAHLLLLPAAPESPPCRRSAPIRFPVAHGSLRFPAPPLPLLPISTPKAAPARNSQSVHLPPD